MLFSIEKRSVNRNNLGLEKCRITEVPLYNPICCCNTVSGDRFFPNSDCNSHGVSQYSVSRFIAAVTDALCSIAKDYIKFPNLHEQSQVQQSFLEKCGFPLVKDVLTVHMYQ